MVQVAGTMPWNVRSKHLTAGLLVVMQCKFHRALDHGTTAQLRPAKFYGCSFNVD